ncbi:unnamed protein product, partial [Ascophyllum nodosum]
MGLFKKIAAAITGFSRGNVRILVVGLDNSGKSTLIEHIKPSKVQSSGLPLLVYANKGDLPGAMSAQECADELGLGGLDSDRNPWHIVRSNALVGSGIEEGVNWLVQTLRPRATRRESSTSDERRRSS